MRRYIRHPADIPISFSLGNTPPPSDEHLHLKDVGLGGLCFHSDKPCASGVPIHIEFPITENFSADGVVAWCHQEDGQYAVGVEFTDEPTQFSVRMIEQICHIEHYRTEEESAGRELSSEQAAQEWVAKFAANFGRG